jgi:hypothetical protein
MNFADPHWTYIWPAYAATAACFCALAVIAGVRLRRWARAARGEP